MPYEDLFPNAAGDAENLTLVVGDGVGTHHTVVNEEPLGSHDGDAGYVGHNSAYAFDLYHIEAPTQSEGVDGPITRIVLHGYFRRTAGLGQTARLYLKPLGGSEVFILCDVVGSSWAEFTAEWTLNPADNEPWEDSDLTDLQIGPGCFGAGGKSAYNTRCTQLCARVHRAKGRSFGVVIG